MPAFVRVCQDCGCALTACPSCGGLQCRCRCPWSATVRKHYDANGVAYELREELLTADERSRRSRRQELMDERRAKVVEMADGGATGREIAEALAVSRRTVFRLKAESVRKKSLMCPPMCDNAPATVSRDDPV